MDVGASRLKTLGSKVWYFFNSLKLTLSVLISLAVISVLGTVVEQNQPVSAYAAKYGATWTKLIVYMRVYDMYHSWWFLLLLVMLTLNIVVCTFERFPPKWKSLLNHKKDKFDPRLIEKLSNGRAFTVESSVAEVRQRVDSVFKKKGYKVMATVMAGEAGGYGVYAWKGIIGRFGSDFTHISLLLILIGSILGTAYGYKGYKDLNVGSVMDSPKGDYKLRLDKFWIDYYDSGQIRQYNSVLTVIEGGKEVLTKQIWVNEPLYYKGTRFYQSNYGAAWDKIEQAYLSLYVKGSDKMGEPFVVKWGEGAAVPGTNYTVKLLGYAADFYYDEKTRAMGSISPDPNNPVVLVDVYEGKKFISNSLLFQKYPGIFPAIPGSKHDLAFVNYRPTLFSGLSINNDPGTNVVWAGSIVMGIGFIFAFFVYHRRVWVFVSASGSGEGLPHSTEVKLGGIINKNQLVFDRELKDIADFISTGKFRS